MPPGPATSEMLAEMSACAYRLGLAFGQAAERAEDPGRRLEMFQLFDRCFFAVRVATALQLRLRREAGVPPARAPAGDAEDLREREAAERAETDSPGRERFDHDRDRDRETEPASLPVLLTTLKGVAADAAALPHSLAGSLADLAPAALPTLQDLLARATGEPPKPQARPRGPALRDRLAGSAAVTVATRATGPPG